jgi:hypothetical protein
MTAGSLLRSKESAPIDNDSQEATKKNHKMFESQIYRSFE